MGGRYLITGVQVGMLQNLGNIPDLKLKKEFQKLITEIRDKQFIADSDQPIERDVECYQVLKKRLAKIVYLMDEAFKQNAPIPWSIIKSIAEEE